MKLAAPIAHAIAFWFCLSPTAIALPGDAIEDVARWIQTNPRLPDGRSGSLRVSRSDIPGQRLTFVAAPTRPTDFGFAIGAQTVRSERLELLDYENGVTRDRLADLLRSVYGLDLHQDYRNARPVYDYVSAAGSGRDTYRGEVRQGDRFGYWIEIIERDGVEPVVGTIAVFQLDDLAAVEADLRDRDGSN